MNVSSDSDSMSGFLKAFGSLFLASAGVVIDTNLESSCVQKIERTLEECPRRELMLSQVYELKIRITEALTAAKYCPPLENWQTPPRLLNTAHPC